jgi:hypothetical protein
VVGRGGSDRSHRIYKSRVRLSRFTTLSRKAHAEGVEKRREIERKKTDGRHAGCFFLLVVVHNSIEIYREGKLKSSHFECYMYIYLVIYINI